jgi:hypothetical protein
MQNDLLGRATRLISKSRTKALENPGLVTGGETRGSPAEVAVMA